VSPPTPGSIHEGGELGYVLTHAFGAAFDNPGLLAVAVVGDGEAETAPLEGAWKGIDFLDAARDGAVLPILHLNGYKISGPTVLGRSTNDAIRQLLSGHGYDAWFVEGDEPMRVHAALAETLDACHDRILAIQRAAHASGVKLPRWPAIVLRTPKGWTGPKELDGVPIEGTFRAHQVPLPKAKSSAKQLAILESWMRSYRPERLFDERGRLAAGLAELAPRGTRRMGANPHANGGKLRVPLELPAIERYAFDVKRPGTDRRESTRQLGKMLRDVFRANAKAGNFRLFCPDETSSNRLDDVFDVETRELALPTRPDDDHVSHHGRVMEVLSEHNCEGWLEGYVLTGRHGLFATYEAFALIVASMVTQHAKWLESCAAIPWREPVPSLNVLLTSTAWRNDHNGFSHQGPGFLDTIISKKGAVSRAYLPPDANSLLAVADHCLRTMDRVNLIIIDKQPQLQWLDLASAREHLQRGASIWSWASNDDGAPDVVMACAGDIPTLETVAAVDWLRREAPELRMRVVNVIDLMSLPVRDEHPHGMSQEQFRALFTDDVDVVFAFHGYAGAVHQFLHGRPAAARFHVRGYREEGTTTTPFDMVVLNRMSRFHLAQEALRRARRRPPNAEELLAKCDRLLAEHHAYITEHFDDIPAIRDFTWSR
jgi:xylulose-5-phosphate/fructose-6-phosphate phosphoketolase